MGHSERELDDVLRDQSIIVPQDAAVFEMIGRWANAPSNTASAELGPPDPPTRDMWGLAGPAANPDDDGPLSCAFCDGDGEVCNPGNADPSVKVVDWLYPIACPRCGGTGKEPNHG